MIGVLLFFAVFALLAWAFYKWGVANYDFFERRNLKYLKPTFLIGSNSGVYMGKYDAVEYSNRLYNTFPAEAICGSFDFRTPSYIVRDPKLMKQICIKDFDCFENHFAFIDDSTDKLWGNALFVMTDEKWRQMRATLSPAFTGSKIRQMFELVADCADDVVKHFLKKAESGEKINIEMKDFFTRYTNDVIATCAFGLKINSFAAPENEFYLNGKILMDFTSFKAFVKIIIITQLPAVARVLNISFLDGRVASWFKRTILETMDVRKKNNIIRHDMINLLMQIREGTLKSQTDEQVNEKEGFSTVEESKIGKVTVNRVWNDDEIVGQCFTFLGAGFDTSATLLAFASYEIAVNPDIQQKLYEEIVNTDQELGGKRITYDVLQRMKYLDQVMCETLRKWSPTVVIDRVCTKDYVYDDGDKLKFKIEKGALLFFPTFAIHRDPVYFPDPERFDPERFSDENKHKIKPETFTPFGLGPRNCIGARFALMETKAILYNLLLNFSFEPNEKTQIPLRLNKSAFRLDVENGLHLELKPHKI